MIKFEYKGKIYKPADFEKKLKSMGITREDVTILEETISKNEEISKLRSLHVDTSKQRYYCFFDFKGIGWCDLKTEDAFDWPWENDRSRFTLMGETLENETIDEAHKRLWKQVLDTIKTIKG